jgi:hypothetical protein
MYSYIRLLICEDEELNENKITKHTTSMKIKIIVTMS